MALVDEIRSYSPPVYASGHLTIEVTQEEFNLALTENVPPKKGLVIDGCHHFSASQAVCER